ncbi:hypothetical protein B0H11DRAFT_1976990 [Mycena galericulata]|nr:hypothetical protein B0H11DRAFT_1976990 [Mycena galericulata]
MPLRIYDHVATVYTDYGTLTDLSAFGKYLPAFAMLYMLLAHLQFRPYTCPGAAGTARKSCAPPGWTRWTRWVRRTPRAPDDFLMRDDAAERGRSPGGTVERRVDVVVESADADPGSACVGTARITSFLASAHRVAEEQLPYAGAELVRQLRVDALGQGPPVR